MGLARTKASKAAQLKVARKGTVDSVSSHGEEYWTLGGTFYNRDTDVAVIRVLEELRIKGTRVRLHYGHTSNTVERANQQRVGVDWLEEHDCDGRISRSTGHVKVPLIVPARSSGGPSFNSACIVKIVRLSDKTVIWQHADYKLPELGVRPSQEAGYECEVTKVHEHDVAGERHIDVQVIARFKTRAQATKFLSRWTYKETFPDSKGQVT